MCVSKGACSSTDSAAASLRRLRGMLESSEAIVADALVSDGPNTNGSTGPLSTRAALEELPAEPVPGAEADAQTPASEVEVSTGSNHRRVHSPSRMDP